MRPALLTLLVLGACAAVRPGTEPSPLAQQDTTRVPPDSLHQRPENRVRSLRGRLEALQADSVLCPMPVAPVDTAAAVRMPTVRPDTTRTIPMPTQRTRCANPLPRR
jgi:hypothetical protein